VCFHTVDRETDVTDVAVTETLQVAEAAIQTDEDVAAGERWSHIGVVEMIYQYLTHTVDIKRSNLIDKLSAKNILSPAEKQKIKEQKKADAKVESLLMMLREKSSEEFESFLTTLSETGQQSVADVVRQALYTVARAGHNPLQYAHGNTVHPSS